MKDLLGDTPAERDWPNGIPREVAELFEKLAFRCIEQGFRRYSADALLHRIRWHFQVERGQRDFKCNDHWTATLSRWFMRVHPDRQGFFETRERRRVEDAA